MRQFVLDVDVLSSRKMLNLSGDLTTYSDRL